MRDSDIPGWEYTPELSIQTLRRRPQSRPSNEPHNSYLRHNFSAKAKFRRQLMTDATIVVANRSWGVHRAELALDSPIIEALFETETDKGLA